MASTNKPLRTLTIQFHATDTKLAEIDTELEVFVDRLVFDDMGLSGQVINLIRMLKGQIAVTRHYITQGDYEQAVADLQLDSDSTGWR